MDKRPAMLKLKWLAAPANVEAVTPEALEVVVRLPLPVVVDPEEVLATRVRVLAEAVEVASLLPKLNGSPDVVPEGMAPEAVVCDPDLEVVPSALCDVNVTVESEEYDPVWYAGGPRMMLPWESVEMGTSDETVVVGFVDDTVMLDELPLELPFASRTEN